MRQLAGNKLMELSTRKLLELRFQRFLKEVHFSPITTLAKMQNKDSKSRTLASKTASTGNSNSEAIVKQGYLKKQKTMKKKYFVLYGESPQAPARLEYYDSEKRFKANHQPKRSIILKNCFNINKQSIGRQKYVIALYTRSDHFSIVYETETEMELWLKLLLQLQWGEDIPEGTPIRPNFEHVWHVRVLEKALGAKNGIFGNYLLCLTDQVISLVKARADCTNDAINFSLNKIRRCGNVDTFFYMEVGHGTVTGAGHLWMEAEDQNIAENIHATILKYGRSCPISCYVANPNVKNMKTTGGVLSSSPSSDSTKPVSIQKCPTLPESSVAREEDDPTAWSQRTQSQPLSPDFPTRRASTGTRPTKIISSSLQTCSIVGVRDRSDSMPTRPRTTSETLTTHLPRAIRTHSSVHNVPVNVLSPGRYRQISQNEGQIDEAHISSSPPSAACSTDSAGSSLSVEGDTVDGQWDESNRLGHPLTPDGEVIHEENLDDYATWQPEDEKLNNYVQADMSYNFANQNSGSVIYRKISPNPMTTSFKSSSPGQGSYMEVYSPCGTSPADTINYMPMSPAEHRTSTTTRPTAINHSRGSSITEEGYVPMTPGSGNDGYVDMDHGSNRHKSDPYQSGDLSITGSSSSVTSGTPSTDHRFSEYPLDKVNSYFPADEEINPAERPTRAYSVGSRPNSINPRNEIPPVTSCERTRAFSVGSRSCKTGFNQLRVALNNSHALSSSHSSVEPSEDMMEMDFSKKGRMRYKKKMTSSERLSVPCGSASTLSSTNSSYSTAEGSYMEMSPRTSSPSLIPSPPRGSRYLAALSKSPPKHIVHDHLQDLQPMFKSSPPVTIGYPSPSLGRVPEGEPGYMEMSSSDSGELKATSSPVYVVHPPPSDAKDKDAYMEMKPGFQVEAKHVIAKNVKARIDSFPESVQPSKTYSPVNANKLSKEEAREAFFRRKLPLIEDNNNSEFSPSVQNASPDEYVEMNMRRSHTKLGKSPDETDYMNMSITPSRRESTRSISKPITIQSNAKEVPESSGYLIGRKLSSATPPKVPGYLPLSSSSSPSTSTLEHRAIIRRNTERRNSKESTNSITTPIFPFSPGNSIGSYDSASKCPVDVSSGTVRLSYHGDSASEEDLSKKTICEDVPADEDYLNYEPDILSGTVNDIVSPTAAVASSPPAAVNSSVTGRKSSAPVFGSKLRPFEKLLSGLGSSFSSLTLGSSPFGSTSRSESQLSQETSSGGDGTLTPPPEDDDKRTRKDPSTRKASDAGSDKKLHYASLDLARIVSDPNDDSGRPSSFRAQSSLTESSSGSTPSPNTTIDATEFRYAEIDFAKISRSNSCSSNADQKSALQ